MTLQLALVHPSIDDRWLFFDLQLLYLFYQSKYNYRLLRNG